MIMFKKAEGEDRARLGGGGGEVVTAKELLVPRTSIAGLITVAKVQRDFVVSVDVDDTEVFGRGVGVRTGRLIWMTELDDKTELL